MRNWFGVRLASAPWRAFSKDLIIAILSRLSPPDDSAPKSVGKNETQLQFGGLSSREPWVRAIGNPNLHVSRMVQSLYGLDIIVLDMSLW
jgi:hypothetical protein